MVQGRRVWNVRRPFVHPKKPLVWPFWILRIKTCCRLAFCVFERSLGKVKGSLLFDHEDHSNSHSVTAFADSLANPASLSTLFGHICERHSLQPGGEGVEMAERPYNMKPRTMATVVRKKKWSAEWILNQCQPEASEFRFHLSTLQFHQQGQRTD